MKAILLAIAMAIPGTAPSPDFDKAAAEATDILQTYLRVDTTNPPGNELRAAEFLKRAFDRENIPAQIFNMGNGRANIYARLKGTGKKKPIILLNHLDVVPADAERWTHPPFAGTIAGGYLWGRGATDMKGTAVMHLMTMFLLKRNAVPLERDVIFLGTADEEEGTANGLEWMIANKRELIADAEFALNEGALIEVEGGKTVAWNVAATEKSVLWLRLSTTGKAGHGSIPVPDGAVPKLLKALDRIVRHETPLRLIPTVESYFRELAPSAPEPLKSDLMNAKAALDRPESRSRLLDDPFRNACLRATISVTGLAGSSKVNVIPGEASATLDCRLLPGDDADAFVENLKKVAAEPSLKVEVISRGKATESPLDTDLMRAIAKARDRFEPGVPLLTPPLTSSTDASTLRDIGVAVYGFEPFRVTDDEDQSHGDDERLSLANIRFGLEVTYFVVSTVASR